MRELLRTRFVWAFTFSKIFMDPVWYFYIFWFPEYLKHARGFDMAKIGNLRLDSVHGGRVRQYPGRLDVGAAPAARLERDAGAQELGDILRAC